MAPRSLRMLARRAALAIAAVVVLTPGLGAPVAGVTSHIPDEPDAMVLDRSSYTALAADMDGDGNPELVRVTNWPIDESRLAIEILKQLPDGHWGAAPDVVIRRGQSVEEARTRQCGVPADADGMLPVLVDDEARLLIWHQGGRPHVFVVVNASFGCGDEPPCCLTVWEVTAAPGTLAPELTLRVDERRGGDIAMAVDMDGDGTDELAVFEPAGPAGIPTSGFSVLRWSDGRFHRVTRSLNAGEEIDPFALGDTDGLPGQEVGLVGSFGPDGSAVGLTRISLREGVINAEPIDLPTRSVLLSLPPESGHGPSLILRGDENHPLVASRWPADGTLTTVATAASAGVPVGILGSGNDRLILVQRDRPPALSVVSAELKPASPATVNGSEAAKPFFSAALSPYIGPWPGASISAYDTFAYAGTLIRTASGKLTATPMAAMPGMAPIGTVGHDAGWAALARRSNIPMGATQLSSGGGRLLRGAEFAISLVPVSQVMQPEADRGAVTPDLEDAQSDPAAPGTGVIVGKPAFGASISAPLGSTATTLAGKSGETRLLTGGDPAGDAGIEITGPPFLIPIIWSEVSDKNQVFDATLQIVTPAGHGYTARWHVRLLQGPPKLEVEDPFLSFGLDATLTGQTDPGATVSAGGRSAMADARGRFTLNVPADLIPRDVRVEARDALGNRSDTTVSVVWPLDYRRLPWIPIVAVLTLAAGFVFFVRTPRLDRRPLSVSVDEGTFEEFDEEPRPPI